MEKILFYIVCAFLTAAVLGGGALYLDQKGHKRGFAARDASCKVEVGELQSRITEAENAALKERDAGRTVADKIAKQLASVREDLNTTQERLDRATSKASSTRRAVSGDLTRMLNVLSVIRERTDPGSDGQARTAAAGAAPAPAAGPAADRDRPAGGFSSERAVFVALKQARLAYTACAVQSNGLNDWADAVTQ